VEHLLTSFTDVEASWQADERGMEIDGGGGGASFAAAPGALLRHAAAALAPAPWDGNALLAVLRDSFRLLPTGCDALDALLNGGVREGQVTELAGESGAGKTQARSQRPAAPSAIAQRRCPPLSLQRAQPLHCLAFCHATHVAPRRP
jgi:hypothetical protein